MVKGLAGRSANLDAEGRISMTPMAPAAYADQLEVVQALAARDANLDDETKDSMTPMALAA